MAPRRQPTSRKHTNEANSDSAVEHQAPLTISLVRLGVSVATSGDVGDQPKAADAASELLQDIFGKDKSPRRVVYGVASLPLGTPVELEVIFEVAA